MRQFHVVVDLRIEADAELLPEATEHLSDTIMDALLGLGFDDAGVGASLAHGLLEVEFDVEALTPMRAAQAAEEIFDKVWVSSGLQGAYEGVHANLVTDGGLVPA